MGAEPKVNDVDEEVVNGKEGTLVCNIQDNHSACLPIMVRVVPTVRPYMVRTASIATDNVVIVPSTHHTSTEFTVASDVNQPAT